MLTDEQIKQIAGRAEHLYSPSVRYDINALIETIKGQFWQLAGCSVRIEALRIELEEERALQSNARQIACVMQQQARNIVQELHLPFIDYSDWVSLIPAIHHALMRQIEALEDTVKGLKAVRDDLSTKLERAERTRSLICEHCDALEAEVEREHERAGTMQQQARDVLKQMGVTAPESIGWHDLVPLIYMNHSNEMHRLIRERDQYRSERAELMRRLNEIEGIAKV